VPIAIHTSASIYAARKPRLPAAPPVTARRMLEFAAIEVARAAGG